MIIQTRDFGEMTLDPAQIINFKQPIFGFESLTQYALLSDSTIGDSFLWLQSTEQAHVCFVLVDPAALSLDYSPELGAETLSQLELKDAAQAAVRVIAVVLEDFEKSTVNLKSPIVINIEKKLGAQVMLDEDYPIRALLIDASREEAPC